MAKWFFINSAGIAGYTVASDGRSDGGKGGRYQGGVGQYPIWDDGTGLNPGDVGFATAKAAVLAQMGNGSPLTIGAVCADSSQGVIFVRTASA